MRSPTSSTPVSLSALPESEQLLAGPVRAGDANVRRPRRPPDAAAAEPPHDAIGERDRDQEGRHGAHDRRAEQHDLMRARREHRFPPEEQRRNQAEENARERDQHAGARAVIAADRGRKLAVTKERLAPLRLGDVDQRMTFATMRAVAPARPGPAADGADLQQLRPPPPSLNVTRGVRRDASQFLMRRPHHVHGPTADSLASGREVPRGRSWRCKQIGSGWKRMARRYRRRCWARSPGRSVALRWLANPGGCSGWEES